VDYNQAEQDYSDEREYPFHPHLSAEFTQAADIELLGAAPLISQTSRNAL